MAKLAEQAERYDGTLFIFFILNSSSAHLDVKMTKFSFLTFIRNGFLHQGCCKGMNKERESYIGEVKERKKRGAFYYYNVILYN